MGAYGINTKSASVFLENEDEFCEAEFCQILKGLENIVADARFEDWLFLFGTAVVSESLPMEDKYDYLFYNFGMLYKGYDPLTQSHEGKRFLIPKRYVSSSDFLTPNRHSIENKTQQILESDSVSVASDDSSMVLNPHYLQHKMYDRDLWHEYKGELNKLDYAMI